MSVYTTPFESTLGGVMAKGRWGAISGDLQLRTESDGDTLSVSVAYAETDEWYPLRGSPVVCAKWGESHRAAHRALLVFLTQDPGYDEFDNPRIVALS